MIQLFWMGDQTGVLLNWIVYLITAGLAATAIVLGSYWAI